jgi:serine/threonine-protein kinase
VDVQSRLTAALPDRYRVERELGAGGMATVYLAHDLRHDREVAIKVLLPELAVAIGADRFLAEIRTTARLQHPHILPLLDSGDADGLLYYVMPFVSGESLRHRLQRERQLPVDDAVRIATQVADALGHAHTHGIIHRDIKPENILLQDGHALVADFGIALAVQSAGGPRLTQTGLSLGTPQYMSPEQAMGEKGIDARTDQYALGAVTYEMLAGEPPFTGATVQAIVAKAIHERPVPLVTIRETVPEQVEVAILRALARLPADRFATAAEFGAALAGTVPTGGSGVRTGAGVAAVREAERWRRTARALGALAVVALLATAAAGFLLWRARQPPPPGGVVRATIRTGALAMLGHPRAPAVAISPDGRTLVYVAGAGAEGQLMLRRLDAPGATPVANAAVAYSPFFSPDGTWLGYVDASGGFNPSRLKKLRLADGTVFDLGPVTGLHGAAWTRDGRIVLGCAQEHDWGIAVMPENGGPVEILARRDSAAGENWLAWPVLTPDGGHVVFTALVGAGIPGSLELLDLRSGTRRRLLGVQDRRDGGGNVAITADGLVVFAANGALFGAELDVAGGRFRHEPVTLIPDLLMGIRQEPGLGQYALGSDGTLVYVSGSERDLGGSVVRRWEDTTLSTNVFTARGPADEGGRPLYLAGLRLVPGTDTLVFSAPSGNRNPAMVRWWESGELWMAGSGNSPARRLAPPRTYFPVPSWDGVWIYTNRLADTAWITGIYRIRRDGSGGMEPIVTEQPGRLVHAYSLTRDGRLLFYLATDSITPPTDVDIYAVETEGNRTPRPMLVRPEHDTHPAISPDGRWLAWTRGLEAKETVVVAPWPALAPQYPVSSGRSSHPTWNADGTALYYLDPVRRRIMAVAVTGAEGLRFGVPRAMSGTLPNPAWSSRGRFWDVDGQGRVHTVIQNPASDSVVARDLTVLVNWGATLRDAIRRQARQPD